MCHASGNYTHSPMSVVALSGGVGGAKLLVGLQRVVGAELTAIVNTGDDAQMYGVHVSPDVDIVTYWLAGIADRKKGWGIRGDTFSVLEVLGELGSETWFSLGDRDLATCLFRTERLRAGDTLSKITDEIRIRLGVRSRILPMSEDPVTTRIVTMDGRTLDFQEYFVKERCAPDVREIRFAGITDARPAPGVIAAVEKADVVVLCPSNPLLSLDPILALPGIRTALRDHPRVTGVSPIVGGAAIKGPAARLLASTGHRSSASAVARLYDDVLDMFVIDSTDPEEAAKVEASGIEVRVTDTLMIDDDASERVARAVLS